MAYVTYIIWIAEGNKEITKESDILVAKKDIHSIRNVECKQDWYTKHPINKIDIIKV